MSLIKFLIQKWPLDSKFNKRQFTVRIASVPHRLWLTWPALIREHVFGCLSISAIRQTPCGVPMQLRNIGKDIEISTNWKWSGWPILHLMVVLVSRHYYYHYYYRNKYFAESITKLICKQIIRRYIPRWLHSHGHVLWSGSEIIISIGENLQSTLAPTHPVALLCGVRI